MHNRFSFKLICYRIFGLLITILIATVMTSTEVIVKGEVPPMMHGVHSTPLGCHMRLYTYKITQSDARGKPYTI